MIKNFLILNFIGKENKIGLKYNKNFHIYEFDPKLYNNDQLAISILNLVKKYKVNIDSKFSILVNSGPGSFSALRVSLAVAKGIKISKNVSLYGYEDADLRRFDLANIELLIKKKQLQKNLIKPLYLS